MTDAPKPTPAAAGDVEGTSLWRDAWRRLLRNRPAVVGAMVVAFMALSAISFPLISAHLTRFTHTENHACLRFQPPGMRGVPREHFRLFPTSRYDLAAVDTDGSGRVSSDELSAVLQRIEFDHLDRDDDGLIGFDELQRAPRSFVASDLRSVFDQLDADGSGGLDLGETDTFTQIFPRSESALFVRTWDQDDSGDLDGDEFLGVPRPEVFYMGTDSLGRDLATRMVFGARISLMVGLLATMVSFLIGVTWGAVAGYYGGRVDAVMMRIVDIIYGLPFMFLVILLMVVTGGRDIRLLFVAIGAVSWLTMARIVRGQVIALKGQEFVLAARSIGTSGPAIVFRHLIPNALGPIIVYATLTVPAVMLQEAFLSFLGLGVQAPDTSWGALANEGASPGVMTHYTWLILFPGAALAVTLLSLNFLGDGLRDALDPRVRKG